MKSRFRLKSAVYLKFGRRCSMRLSPASCECCLAFPKVWWEDIHLWVDRSPRDRIDNLQIKWQWVTEVNFVEWCWQKPVLPCFSCAKTCWGSLWSYPCRARYEYHGLVHTEKKEQNSWIKYMRGLKCCLLCIRLLWRIEQSFLKMKKEKKSLGLSFQLDQSSTKHVRHTVFENYYKKSHC